MIIWTPRFIISFTLLLILGLSGATMLTNGMLNGYYAPGLILLLWTLGGGACLFFLSVRARSFWVRLGGGIGCLWSVLSGLTCVLTLLPLTSQSTMLLYTATATSCVLLACYVCLSIAHVSWQRWDTMFFRTIPALLLLTGFAFLLRSHTWSSLTFVMLVALLILSIAIWWIRPSCWREQAGPALLFGLAPLTLLSQVLPDGINSEPGFFFAQVAFLCLILATLCLSRCELLH